MEKKLYLKVKDYSVSGEEFQLFYDQEMEMLETRPQPSPKKLPDYYKSEDYISHTDNNRNLFEQAYHLVKWISLKRKLRLINSFQSGKSDLLDVGCGTGDFLKIAQQNNWNVKGIEPNEKARELANIKTNHSVFGNEQLLKFEPSSFDIITLWHVLEHLPRPEEHISIFKKLLRPNGVLIIAVPNFKSYDAQFYKGFWAAYDVPRHLWHFSKHSISKLAACHKMKVSKILPMRFDAFYVCLLSEKYKSGFMNPLKAFWTAYLSNLKANSSKEYSSLIYIIKDNEK